MMTKPIDTDKDPEKLIIPISADEKYRDMANFIAKTLGYESVSHYIRSRITRDFGIAVRKQQREAEKVTVA